MKASSQKLVKEFKAVVVENDDVEFQDTSQLKALLPLWPTKIPIPKWRSCFKILRNEHSALRFK